MVECIDQNKQTDRNKINQLASYRRGQHYNTYQQRAREVFANRLNRVRHDGRHRGQGAALIALLGYCKELITVHAADAKSTLELKSDKETTVLHETSLKRLQGS